MIERCLQSARERCVTRGEEEVKEAVAMGVVGKWMEREVKEGKEGRGGLVWD